MEKYQTEDNKKLVFCNSEMEVPMDIQEFLSENIIDDLTYDTYPFEFK